MAEPWPGGGARGDLFRAGTASYTGFGKEFSK